MGLMSNDLDLKLPDVVEAWRNAISALDAQRQDLADNGDVPMLSFGLDRIRELRRQLGDLERAVEGDVASLMDGKTEVVDGLGTLERRKSTDRKGWDSIPLLNRVIRDAIDPDGTGELPPAGEVLERVVSTVTECAPVTPSMGWRVTALRARGIDPDEWATTTPGRTSITIHKADQ